MYDKEYLKKLTDDELNDLLLKEKSNQSRNKVQQQSIKVTLNSCYGMLGNEYSRYYDTRIAEGITMFGQLAIRWVSDRVNKELNKILKTDDFDFIIAGDTDSVVGGTMIYVNDNKISIEDYYSSLPDDYVKFEKGNEVKFVNDDTTKSYDDDVVENKRIKYAMKHEVEKEMFEIECGDDKVVVTEDHSIVVYCVVLNKLISVKPKEIKSTDLIIHIT